MPQDPVREALTTEYVQKLLKIKAKQLRRRPEFRGVDQEELQQDLALHVLQKAHLFDPARGAVNTFIATVVETAAAMMCRARRRLKRGASLRPQSLEGTTLQGPDGDESSLAEALRESDLRRRYGGDVVSDFERALMAADVAHVLTGLVPDLRRVARLLMDGAREATISRRLGMSRRRVRKATDEIWRRLGEAGLGDFPSGRTGAAPTA